MWKKLAIAGKILNHAVDHVMLIYLLEWQRVIRQVQVIALILFAGFVRTVASSSQRQLISCYWRKDWGSSLRQGELNFLFYFSFLNCLSTI